MRVLPPCGRQTDVECPYREWARRPDSRRPTGLSWHGVDRYNRRRLVCGSCGKSFTKPTSERMGFKDYRRVEAVLAHGSGESTRSIASRLAVSRAAVLNWVADWPVDWIIDEPRASDLEDGRWARIVQDVTNAPYVVGPQDQTPFLRASLAELSHALKQRRIIVRRFDESMATASDQSRPYEERQEVVRRTVERMLKALPDMATPPWSRRT